MTAAFQPIGDQSRRVIALNILADAEYDSVVKYADLEARMNVSRETAQAAVNAAKPALEKLHRKAVVAVPNEGYRVVKPSEQHGLAVVHQKKSVRAMRRGLSKVNHVDTAQLTDGEKAAVTLAATSISLQLDYMRRNDIRAKRHEDMIHATQQKADRTETEIAELKARLAQIEKGNNQ